MTETSKPKPPTEPGSDKPRGWAYATGPLIGLLVYLWLPEQAGAAADAVTDGSGQAAAGAVGLSHAGRVVAGVGVTMAFWWVTEALPLAVTALVPIALLPILTGGSLDIESVAAPYAHEMVFLFLGGFIIGRAIEHRGLHRRIALNSLRLAGTQPRRIIGAFMLASAFLSMWVSNTATAVMMLPIALSVIELVGGGHSGGAQNAASAPDAGGARTIDPASGARSAFAAALLLGIAYGPSIGGMATLIGTPPNALLAGFVEEQYGIEISFARWMLVGGPLAAILLPLAWVVLTRVAIRVPKAEISGAGRAFKEELHALGRMSQGERMVAVVFVVTALAWVFRQLLAKWSIAGVRPLAGLTDSGIGMVAGVVLFMLPAGKGQRVLGWAQMKQIPWGVLILFGGGLSLARAAKETGLATFIGHSVSSLEGVSAWVLVLAVVTSVVFLTELTSNTATAAAFLPVVGASAIGLGHEPLIYVVPAALAASCAFMMPVATPPNAIVFSSGALTVSQMCRVGIWLNVLAVAILMAVARWLTPLLAPA